MKQKKISGGSARLGQLMLLMFFCPFIILLLYLIISKDLSSGGIIFLLALMTPILLIVRKIFMFGDIYISGNRMMIKKLFSTSDKSIEELLKIDKSLIPFAFYLRFKGGSRIMFFSDTSDIFKQTFSNEIDYMPKSLKEILKTEEDLR